MSALAQLTKNEVRLALREPAVIFWIIGFPVLLLVIFGLIPSFSEPEADLGGLRVIDIYVPTLLAMTLAMSALMSLPQTFASYREQGVLKRIATTPVPPSKMLGALLGQCALAMAVMSALVLVVARVAFGVRMPSNVAGFILTLVLIAVAVLGLGLLAAAVAPNGKAAGAIGSILFFPLMFFAGLWLPLPAMPETLRAISEFTPLGAGVQALSETTAGTWPSLHHLAVLAAYGIVFYGLAVKFFRWQ